MLDILAGITIFIFLYIAKRTLVFVILRKKFVAFSVAVIVLSELLMLFVLYLSIEKYRLSGAKLLIGFLVSLILMVMLYCIRFLARGKRERRSNGEF